jgi:hypothetical protein
MTLEEEFREMESEVPGDQESVDEGWRVKGGMGGSPSIRSERCGGQGSGGSEARERGEKRTDLKESCSSLRVVVLNVSSLPSRPSS